MKMVIDIPDRIQYGIEIGITVNGSEASQIVLDAVKNGTPLPKGHGRIGDLDKLQKVLDEYVLDRKDCPLHIASEIYYNIDTFDTIIGVDKEG